MNFAKVDPIISAWSCKNDMPLATLYQGAEVRSFELVGRLGRAQIWVEVNEEICVHVWDYRERKQSFIATLATLDSALDRALAVARTWVSAG